MPYLIIPSETGLIRPAGPLEINWNSGLSDGLRSFLVMDGKGMTDLVTGRRYAATGGSHGIGRYGPAWVSGGSGTYITGQTGVEAQAIGNYRNGSGVTVFFAGEFTTTGSPSACPISCATQTSVGGWAIKTEQWPDVAQVGYSSRGVTDQTSGISTPSGPSIISVRMAQTGTNYYRVNDLAVTTSTNAAPIQSGDVITIGASRGYGAYEDVLYSGNLVYWAAIYNRDVSEGLRNVLHKRPFGSLVTRKNSGVYSFPSTGGPTYTIACDSGSYTLTGTATGLVFNRVMPADVGSYTLTGTAASLIFNRKIGADPGSYTYAGTDANLFYNRVLPCDVGSYTLTGTATGLVYNRVITLDSGSYTLTGTDATLTYTPTGTNYVLTCDPGSYTLTGTAAGLVYNRVLVCDVGSYTLTGTAATFTHQYNMTADPGSYTLTGTAAGLVYNRVIACDIGSYTLTGTAATLTYSGQAVWTVQQDESTTWSVQANASTTWTVQ